MLSLDFNILLLLLLKKMHICFLNIRLIHAQLKSDHRTADYVKAAQTLLSNIWLIILFTLLSPQIQHF